MVSGMPSSAVYSPVIAQPAGTPRPRRARHPPRRRRGRSPGSATAPSTREPVGAQGADLVALRVDDACEQQIGRESRGEQEHRGEEPRHLPEALKVERERLVRRLIDLKRDGVGPGRIGEMADLGIQGGVIGARRVAHEHLVLDGRGLGQRDEALRDEEHAEVLGGGEELLAARRRPEVLGRHRHADHGQLLPALAVSISTVLPGRELVRLGQMGLDEHLVRGIGRQVAARRHVDPVDRRLARGRKTHDPSDEFPPADSQRHVGLDPLLDPSPHPASRRPDARRRRWRR